MLDIKLIRENPEFVRERLAARYKDYNGYIDRLCELDILRRQSIADMEQKKAQQNSVSKKIPDMKKRGEDTSELLLEMKTLSDEVKTDNDRVNEIDAEIENILLYIPNLPNIKVPMGEDDSANVEIRRWGDVRNFNFDVKPHWDLGASLEILDPERAAKVTGARFHFYRNAGAKLERAVINYYLDTHSSNGYTEIFPPFIVNRDSMRGTGQLPKFEEDAFRLDGYDYFLIPTAEVPVTNLHRDEILTSDMLPIKYCAYSACFRAEAGSAGRDTRGLIRQHQFNKVELVKFADPEKSYEELESLTADAQAVLMGLGLPHRVVCLSSGDMGFSSAMTYDIEVWMPSYNRYVEISSCSNFEDFQSRRANIKFKRDSKDKAKFVHTLNGSGVAVGRTVAAIIENFQNEDGSVTVPEVLRKYTGFDTIR